MLKKRPSTQFVTPHSSAQRWPRRTSAPSVFTAFVGGLQGARTPDADLFHDTWHGLRAALVQEMKRRGLWESPPHYLGVCGWERWDSEAQGAGPARAERPGRVGRRLLCLHLRRPVAEPQTAAPGQARDRRPRPPQRPALPA